MNRALPFFQPITTPLLPSVTHTHSHSPHSSITSFSVSIIEIYFDADTKENSRIVDSSNCNLNELKLPQERRSKMLLPKRDVYRIAWISTIIFIQFKFFVRCELIYNEQAHWALFLVYNPWLFIVRIMATATNIDSRCKMK